MPFTVTPGYCSSNIGISSSSYAFFKLAAAATKISVSSATSVAATLLSAATVSSFAASAAASVCTVSVASVSVFCPAPDPQPANAPDTITAVITAAIPFFHVFPITKSLLVLFLSSTHQLVKRFISIIFPILQHSWWHCLSRYQDRGPALQSHTPDILSLPWDFQAD